MYIINSIVHKLQIGTWNQMSIYDDHIHVWNEGVLPEDYTVETLMSKHISKPRNPKMARAFYLAGFIEAWGRGYEKIIAEFDKANLTRPTFRVEQGGITADIPREIFMSIRGDQKPTRNPTRRIKLSKSSGRGLKFPEQSCLSNSIYMKVVSNAALRH
ncbi:MAG: hypothetical protein NC080_05775 [Paraprevotella sp.]|nr:hypothetical protein [Paraprevotella sp.]